MDGYELSRREILAGLGGAGGAGALLGTGTVALLEDEVTTRQLFRTGSLDLVVDGNGETIDGAVARVGISLRPGATAGSTTFAVRLRDDDGNNPAYVWVRSSCPEPPTELADALQVRLAHDRDDGAALFAGTLRELAEWLLGGRPLSPSGERRPPGEQGCLSPGEALPLRLEWTLDEEYAGSGSLGFDLEFHARQCRASDGTTNPFPTPEVLACEGPPPDYHGVSYVEIWACEGDGEDGEEDDGDCDCTRIGKLELEDDYCGEAGVGKSFVEPGRTYTLYDDGEDCTPTGYRVAVTETSTKADGDADETTGLAFELLEDGATGPDLCRVDVKGGPTAATYDDPSHFDGNATAGVLTAPERDQ